MKSHRLRGLWCSPRVSTIPPSFLVYALWLVSKAPSCENNKEDVLSSWLFCFLRIPNPMSFVLFFTHFTISWIEGKKKHKRGIWFHKSRIKCFRSKTQKNVGLGAYLIFECSMPVPFVKRNHYFQWLSMSGLDNMFENDVSFAVYEVTCTTTRGLRLWATDHRGKQRNRSCLNPSW